MNNTNFGQQQQGQQGFGGGPQPQPLQQQGQQPAQQQGSNPLQPVYAPNPTMVNPTLSGFNTNPQSIINQIMTAFGPQANQANQSFMDTMALSGLSGGPVQSGEQQLQGQLAAGLAPELGNAIQFSQGQGLEQALANAGFSNQASSQNANAWNTQGMFNAGEGTNAGQMLAQLFQQMNLAGMGGQQGIAQGAQQNFGIQAPMDWSSLGQLIGQGGQNQTPYTPGYNVPYGV
jgi:hypothetical protein